MAIIQSGVSDATLTIETAFNSARVTHFPRTVIGSYLISTNTGSIAASTAANSVLWTFKNTGTTTVVVRQISVGLQITTAYTKGSLRLSAFVVRAPYTQGTTNATLQTTSGNNGKKRTSHATSTAVIYACTTTGITGESAAAEDTTPFATALLDLTNAISTQPQSGLATMFQIDPTEFPLIIEPDEGIRIKNPTAFAATGISTLIVNIDYDEVTTY
jgi:hypothetical protein